MSDGISTFREDWELEMQRLEAQASQSQAEAEQFASNQSIDEYKTFQVLAKTDLFFLTNTILGYDRLSPNLHGDLGNWMVDTDNEQFREILLPRGHFKSTEATIGDSIRQSLPDVTGNAPWPACLGTDIRLAIFHEAREQAMRFLFAITSAYLSNPWLRALFPEAIPNRNKQKINLAELELPRKKNHPEPTIDTGSTGSRGQGRHYNFLKLDDLIGDKARDSETEMKSAIAWFDNIQSFFSDFRRDRFDLIGTRWAMDDLYEHVHRTYGDKLKKYIRPVVERNADGELVPIFPEEFSLESLEILKKNAIVYNSQYLNDPTSGTREFKPEWKRYFAFGSSPREVVVMDEEKRVENLMQSRVINPYMTLHSGLTAPDIIPTSALDIVFLIDPAMSGESGFLVTGMDTRRRVFLLEAIKRALRPPEFVDLLFEKVAYWMPRTVVIEEVLFSGLFGDWLPREMIIRGLKFHISMHKTGGKEKDARVRQLTNYFSAGQIYAPPGFSDFWEEYDYFGTSKKYHLLDALAQGPSYWMPGNRMKQSAELAERERAMLAGRSNSTGYSRIR